MARFEMLAAFGIMLALVAGCVSQAGPELKTPSKINSCGNNVCELKEDCSNCPQDCGCKGGEYCDKTGICKPQICGNKILEPDETSENCCSDAGCKNDLICNEKTQTCIEKVNVGEQAIRQTVEDYVKEKDLNATIDAISDAYYKEQQAKKVTLKCHVGNNDYPCGIIIYIDSQGKIIETIFTT